MVGAVGVGVKEDGMNALIGFRVPASIKGGKSVSSGCKSGV